MSAETKDSLKYIDVPDNDKLTEVTFDLEASAINFKIQRDYIFITDKYIYVKFKSENDKGLIRAVFVNAYTSKNKEVVLNSEVIDPLCLFVENYKITGEIILMVHIKSSKIIIIDIIKAGSLNLADKSYNERLDLIRMFGLVVEVNGVYEIKDKQESYKDRVLVIDNSTFSKNKSTFCRKLTEQGLKMTKYYIKDSAERLAVGKVILNEPRKKSCSEKLSEYILVVDSTDDQGNYIVNGLGKCKNNIKIDIPIAAQQLKNNYILPDILLDKTLSLFSYPVLIKTSLNSKKHPEIGLPILEIYKNSQFVQEKDKLNLQKIDINTSTIKEKTIETIIKTDSKVLVCELKQRGIESIDLFEKTISPSYKFTFLQTRQHIEDKIHNKQYKGKTNVCPVVYECLNNPIKFTSYGQSQNESKETNIKFKRLSSLINNNNCTALASMPPAMRAKFVTFVKNIIIISNKYNRENKELYEQTYNNIEPYFDEIADESIYFSKNEEFFNLVNKVKEEAQRKRTRSECDSSEEEEDEEVVKKARV